MVRPLRRALALSLLSGCGWTLPAPIPAPDVGAADRAAPVDRPDASTLDAPRVDVADVSFADLVATDRVDVVILDRPDAGFADAPAADRPDAPTADRAAPLDAPVADVTDVPVGVDVVAPQDVVMTECVPGTRRTCYTGPPATRGVGACRDGIQTCQSDGRWPTLCDGQSLPLCASRVCGPDGCGGSCGTCAGGTLCDDTGRCMPVTCGAANFTLTCPDATRCPRDSHCVTGGRCECDEGFVAESCAGAACGACTFPNWWCRRAYFCGGGAITCPGGYLCPVRSRCETTTMSCDCEPGFVAVDCTGARCTSCPGVSYRCVRL